MQPAVKNLLIITVLAFAASLLLEARMHYDLNAVYGLHYYTSPKFGVWQFVTFVFMHGGFNHIFFNMFALFMFGNVVERELGTQKFLIYYLVAGVGSGLIQEVALSFDIAPFVRAVDECMNDINTETIQSFIGDYRPNSFEAQEIMGRFVSAYNGLLQQGDTAGAIAQARVFLQDYSAVYVSGYNTVGASGAIFALLLAYGMMFPNSTIYLFMILPIKAKYFVMLYGLMELFFGVGNFQADHVAHWAHLGGMLFGFVMLKMWKVQRLN